MDAALELFSSKGYEKTMIIDIVKKTGVAKGTFFYHFPTKEAILEEICARWASELATSFLVKSRQLSALDKLRFFIEQFFLPSYIDTLYDSLVAGNQFNLLYKLWQQQLETVFNPMLADIIRQGKQEGTMNVDLINETLAFFWSTLDCLFEAAYNKEPSAVFTNKLQLAQSILERILRIEDGALELTIAQH
nr:TetR/AcrR family transcriptional regulator [uncultured Sporomusa sp.]